MNLTVAEELIFTNLVAKLLKQDQLDQKAANDPAINIMVKRFENTIKRLEEDNSILVDKLLHRKAIKPKFTIEDVKDQTLLNKLISEETNRICYSDKARNGRTDSQIYESVKQGKVPEVYLVETGDFEFADIKWHDLKNANGEYVEVKAYKSMQPNKVALWSSEFVKRDLERYTTEKWCKSTWYMLFAYTNGTYEYLGTRKIYKDK